LGGGRGVGEVLPPPRPVPYRDRRSRYEDLTTDVGGVITLYVVDWPPAIL
jgi:hypothetical protein